MQQFKGFFDLVINTFINENMIGMMLNMHMKHLSYNWIIVNQFYLIDFNWAQKSKTNFYDVILQTGGQKVIWIIKTVNYI